MLASLKEDCKRRAPGSAHQIVAPRLAQPFRATPTTTSTSGSPLTTPTRR